jgi:aminoglycoside 3-N-acetyltransferase I
MAATHTIEIRQLGHEDRQLARATFVLMAEVFAETCVDLSDAYIDRLLARSDFWVFAAVDGARPAGGLTAHILPMTIFEGSEVFIYDIAVAPDHQRRGIGRGLLEAVRSTARNAGIATVFVLADDEDSGALDFYRATSGAPSNVTLFEFRDP